MQIIPVIDLKDGQAVHAKPGKRDAYQPVLSKLCQSAEPHLVLAGFLALHNFTTAYLADLNAIAGNGNNQALIDDLIATHPQITFWLDNGTKIQHLKTQNYLPVIGSESQDTGEVPAGTQMVLSLDFAPDYIGPPALLENSFRWGQDIIVMSLDLVGKNAGVDTIRLADFCHKYPTKNFIAGGGVRHPADLLHLQQIGVAAALVASALHNGSITSADIARLATGSEGYWF